MDLDPIRSDGLDRLATVDLSVYGMDSILKSAHRFTGRGFVHISAAKTEQVEVRMRPKNSTDDPEILIRDFLNDLLDQKLRTTIASETATLRDQIMAHALSRTGLLDLTPSETGERGGE